MAENVETDLVVLGAGPGGYAAAFLAADLGMRVALVDAAPKPGGVCLHCGCIPSKALLHAARVITEAHEAGSWGLHFQPRFWHSLSTCSWCFSLLHVIFETANTTSSH